MVWTLGQSVRWLRKEKRLTQAQLAEKAGVSTTTIYRLETDENYEGVTLAAVAGALDMSTAELMAWTPPAAFEERQSPDRLEYIPIRTGDDEVDTERLRRRRQEPSAVPGSTADSPATSALSPSEGNSDAMRDYVWSMLQCLPEAVRNNWVRQLSVEAEKYDQGKTKAGGDA